MEACPIGKRTHVGEDALFGCLATQDMFLETGCTVFLVRGIDGLGNAVTVKYETLVFRKIHFHF